MSTIPLATLRPVHVVGVGMHPYQFPSETPYVHLGLVAIRAALADARLRWPDVEAAFVGTTGTGMASGRTMFRHLGSTGLAVMQVENASASGSAAFRQAITAIACGEADVALAVGVDKFGDARRSGRKDGIERLSDSIHIPLVKFALLARDYLDHHGLTPADMARVAVKNHGNAARNPFAQFRKPRTLAQVMASPKVVGELTALQCTPRGEGGAAAIVASEGAIRRLGLEPRRAIRVASSVMNSEPLDDDSEPAIVAMCRDSAGRACRAAGVRPEDLDIVELHDAFSIEELVYTEAFGLCGPGEAAGFLASGASAIGGRCAVNPSGGLLAQGHPLGPTGIGQIAEIVRQLRGENGERQHPNAKTGLAHMIGVGSISIAHVLCRD